MPSGKNKTKKEELVCEPKTDPKTKKNVLVCSLDIGTRSGKHLSEPIEMILNGTYTSGRPRLHKLLDVIGGMLLLALIGAILWFALPRSTPNLVTIDASVAPSEVITGGNSTLTFRYENKSDETIRNARILFDFPEHFLLAGFETESEQVTNQEILIGDIRPTEYGFIHVTGTMFGDVGGQQIFTTTLTYDYGEDQTDAKVKEHQFSPTGSTLSLELTLPDYLVSKQRVDGSIRYTNTGDVTFPDLRITPNWPATFDLRNSNVAMENDGSFHVRGIEPGETGVITFDGVLGEETDNTFIFEPYFLFADTEYSQTTLIDSIDILPPPLIVTHQISERALDPGAKLTAVFSYENVSGEPLQNVQFSLTGPTAVLGVSGIGNGYYEGGVYYVEDVIDLIAPGERGEITMTIPVKRSVSSGLDSYENIQVNTESSATMNFNADEISVPSNTVGTALNVPLTSPFLLSSFARYYAPSGDQLGRGPLPPAPNETTKYWIFWNISGTTNEISNLEITAPLGPNVTLTGRQSVSIGTSVSQENGNIVWNVSSLEPTMPSNSTVIGAAFEVAVTPTDAQIDTSPLLIGAATATAKDEFTGALVSGSAPGVTTLLLNDSKGAAYGSTVQP